MRQWPAAAKEKAKEGLKQAAMSDPENSGQKAQEKQEAAEVQQAYGKQE